MARLLLLSGAFIGSAAFDEQSLLHTTKFVQHMAVSAETAEIEDPDESAWTAPVHPCVKANKRVWWNKRKTKKAIFANDAELGQIGYCASEKKKANKRGETFSVFRCANVQCTDGKASCPNNFQAVGDAWGMCSIWPPPKTYVLGWDASGMKKYQTLKDNEIVNSLTASMMHGLFNTLGVEIGDWEAGAAVQAEDEKFAAATLVEVRGLRRSFAGTCSADPQHYGKLQPQYTPLTVAEDATASLYGALFPVSEEELAESDEEHSASGFVLHQMSASGAVRALHGDLTFGANDIIRWYVKEGEGAPPSRQCPIAQTYVDLLVGGAIGLQREHEVADFAINVINSIHGWSREWVNDRQTPYRPQLADSDAFSIVDTLVQATAREGATISLVEMGSVYFPGGVRQQMSASFVNEPPVGNDEGTVPEQELNPLPEEDVDNLYILSWASDIRTFEFFLRSKFSPVKSLPVPTLEGLLGGAVNVTIGNDAAKDAISEIVDGIVEKMLLVEVQGIRKGLFNSVTGNGNLPRAMARGYVEQGSDYFRSALDVTAGGTYLGAVVDATAKGNFIAWPVSREFLDAFDAYQGTEYYHSTIDPSQVTVLNEGEIPANAKIRWYCSGAPRSPLRWATGAAPITQSYIDTVVAGALQYEQKFGVEGFAAGYINSIEGWNAGPWVNDRSSPYRQRDRDSFGRPVIDALVKAAQVEGSPLSLQSLGKITFPGGRRQAYVPYIDAAVPHYGRINYVIENDIPEGVPLYEVSYGGTNYFASAVSAAKVQSISIPQLRSLMLDLEIGVNSQNLLDQVEAQYNVRKNYILAKVKGIQRGFYRRTGSRGETHGAIDADNGEYLTGALDVKHAFWGAAPIADATSYVMLTEVTDRAALQARDESNAGSYSNMWLTTSDIEVLGDDDQLPANAAVRWWPNKEENLRTGASPQVLSQVYIDEKLGGAIELGEIKNVPDFALGIVTTCTGWGEYPWVNDRATVYMPEENDKYSRRVDALLWEAANTPGSELKKKHLERIGFTGQAPDATEYTRVEEAH